MKGSCNTLPESTPRIDEVRDGRHLMDHPPVMYRREACAGRHVFVAWSNDGADRVSKCGNCGHESRVPFVEPSLDRMRENAASWVRAVEAYGHAKFIAEVGPGVRAALNTEQRTGEEGV